MPANTVSTQQWALAAGLALMAVWGVNFAVTKVVLAEVGVSPFLFIRFLAMPLFGFALLGFLFTLYLVFVEVAILKAYCPFCVASQVTMTLIFILSVIRLVREPQS